VTYLPNFPDLSFRTDLHNFEHTNEVPVILCVANLRFPKDHTNLVSAIEILHNERHSFKVWLVGKDFHDQYSTELKAQIASAGLEKIIDILGDRTDIADLLAQADIGVLSSASEGLPVSLLEYGLAGLPVVATDVGECRNVVSKCGIIVPPDDANSLANALRLLVLNSYLRHQLGDSYKNHISLNFSPEIISKKLIFLYNSLLV
jgi:glycosyltransferase involved in cell wall biosynthesis